MLSSKHLYSVSFMSFMCILKKTSVAHCSDTRDYFPFLTALNLVGIAAAVSCEELEAAASVLRVTDKAVHDQ